MNNLKIEDVIELFKEYNLEDVDKVKKAYEFAKENHFGQTRRSGEEYIIHPLNVAYILEEIHADIETVSAGFLHDILEETDVSKKDLAQEFGLVVLKLTEGVTKLPRDKFMTKEMQNLVNTRRVIASILKDVRIIIIKLADRLHNMRTMEFQTPFKQKENSYETLAFYVPIAYNLGLYQIKSELEDLSFKYLNNDMYKKIEEVRYQIIDENSNYMKEIQEKISASLADENIKNEINMRVKSIYEIYKKINYGYKINEINDLLALKILVKEIDECYKSLSLVHNIYTTVDNSFKDYIINPKINMYQSLHSTVISNDKLVQIQTKTYEMNKFANIGIASYYDLAKENSGEVMQENIKNYPIFKTLQELNMISDNKEFIEEVSKKILIIPNYLKQNEKLYLKS